MRGHRYFSVLRIRKKRHRRKIKCKAREGEGNGVQRDGSRANTPHSEGEGYLPQAPLR